MNANSFFPEQIRQLKDELKKLEVRKQRITKLRVVSFLCMPLGSFILYGISLKPIIPFSITLFFTVLIILISYSVKIDSQIRRCNLQILINRREIKINNHQFDDIEGGEQFADTVFGCTNDLDLVGDSSLFQLLNRCGTELGKKKLVQWMNVSSIHIPKILRRQNAVKELASDIPWVQKFQVAAITNPTKSERIGKLLSWVIRSKVRIRRWQILYPFISLFLLISSMILVYRITEFFILTIVILALNKFYLDKLKEMRNSIALSLRGNTSVLKNYLEMIQLLKIKKFESRYLTHLISGFDLKKSEDALKQITYLGKLVELSSLRGISYEPISRNLFYIIFNWIFLSDIFLIKRIENWRIRVRSRLPNWLEVISEIECLSSLAIFTFANEGYSFPEFEKRGFTIQAKRIGHPLIHQSKRVYNDIEILNNEVSVITGSNMSGKSTFLRTLGINVILANMGAPVCAGCFSLSDVKPITSMRITDSLSSGISLFQNQLMSIKRILQAVKDDKRSFFLIDETFNGTNAKDRHEGVLHLLLTLLTSNCSGCLATHDTEVAHKLADNSGIKNYYFESRIYNNQLQFDYKIKKGICNDTNASFLLKQINLD